MIYICDALRYLVPHSVVPNFRGGGVTSFRGGEGVQLSQKKNKI